MSAQPKPEAKQLEQEGIQLIHQGYFQEAVKVLAKADSLMPNDFTIINNLGYALYHCGQYKKAQSFLQRALSLNDSYAIVFHNLALAFKEDGDLTKAYQCLQDTLARDPHFLEAYLNLGHVCRDLNQAAEAVGYYHKALTLSDNRALTHAALADLYEATGDSEQAITHANQALQEDPSQTLATLVLARIEKDQGKLTNANRRLAKLIQVTPKAQDKHTIAAELAQVLDKEKNYTDAFETMTKAKKALISEPMVASRFKKHTVLNLINEISHWLPKQDFNGWTAVKDDLPVDPIFFVGFPRSGTTLMEQMLNCHPGLVTADEKPLLNETIQHLLATIKGDYLSGISHLSEQQIKLARAYYWQSAKKHQIVPALEQRLVDKLPLNIINLYVIQRLFPSAKIIVAIRDPRDCCLSSYMQDFKLVDGMLEFLDWQSTATLYAKTWQLFEQYQAKLNLPIHTYHYEALVNAPKDTCQDIIRFLDLEWSEDLLDFHQSNRGKTISTPSYRAVRQPIYQSAKARWRNYASACSTITPTIKAFIAKFGYDNNETPTI